MSVNGYELTSEWKAANRGFTAFAAKGGKKYFLKKYGMYRMPKRDSSTSEKLYGKMKKEFDSFTDNRTAINKALADFAGPGGNIILPLDWFIDDSCFIEATEFVNDLIEDEDILNLSVEDKIYVMRTAAAALYNIHKKKIVHSDLKRTNILAARNSAGKISAKIIDFDMSYFEYDIRPEELGGDQNFMSPELAQCFMYDFSDEALAYMSTKSDIFSLGLVFHDYLVTEKYKNDKGEKHTRGCHPKKEGLTGKLKDRADAGKTVYCSEALLAGGKLVVSGKIKEKYLRHLIAAMIQPEPEDRPTAQEVLAVFREKKILDLKSDSVMIEGEDIVPCSRRAEREVLAKAKVPAEPVVMPTPEGYCKPWDEHKISFDESKLSENDYAASERIEKDGKKYYRLYRKDGRKTVFTVENLVMLGYAKRTGVSEKTKPEPDFEPTFGIIVHDGTMWESDCEYSFDNEYIKRNGYVRAARAERKSIKGYVLEKPSGELRFMTFEIMRLLRFIVKK